MNKGLPIFRLAKSTIKGFFPTSKGGNNLTIPIIGTIEEKTLYYIEFHPEILFVERADIDDAFTNSHNLYKTELTPIIIPYEFEGKIHQYYPDFLITLKGGRTAVVEVGKKDEKLTQQPLLKALAAIEYCINRGWEYWFILDDNIMTDIKRNNFEQLKNYNKSMYKNSELHEIILSYILKNPKQLTIESLASAIQGDYSPKEVEMAVYEFICQATMEGRVVFDFDKELLNKKSIIEIIPEEQPPIIPENIFVPYDKIQEYFENCNVSSIDEGNSDKLNISSHFDTDEMSDDEKDSFFRKRSAVLEAISTYRKESITTIAQKYNLTRQNLYNLIENYQKYGESGLIKNYHYNGKKTQIDEKIQEILIKLRKQYPKQSISNLCESVEFKRELMKLAKKSEKIYVTPSYWSIYRFLSKLKIDDDKFPSRNSKKEKTTTLGAWVKSIPRRLSQVQVDECYLDIKIVTENREYIAGRIYAVVIIDVKTANILGHWLSLKKPMEEDYMMALKRCIEPKEEIASTYHCKNNWMAYGIPTKILSDNGKIFVSKRSTDVVAKRLRIVEEIAPPYAPDVKGTIEALFEWVLQRFISKMPGFTKNRKPEEIKKEALEYGITFEEFEELFVQAIVDVYTAEWDDLRKQTRYNLWIMDEQLHDLSDAQWLGSPDELKLLLMKEEQNRKVDRHGISFGGRYYQNISMLKAIENQPVSIRYDKRDISIIYVYLNDGSYYCEAYCQELLGRRLSIWEDKIEKQGVIIQKNSHNVKASSNMFDIQKNAKRKKSEKVKEQEAKILEQSRLFDKQDIHTSKVVGVLKNIRIDSDTTPVEDTTPEEEPTPSKLIDINFKPLAIRKLSK